MLVVKVEVWPGGDADRSVEISRIGLANVTNLQERSDYEMVALLARDTGKEEVIRGEVQKHERSTGWMPLVRRALTTLLLRDELAQSAPYDDEYAERLRRG